MSDVSRCNDCSRPIRLVRLGTWNGALFPIDFSPSKTGGEYAVLGTDTAAYVKVEDRGGFVGPLYADHRRTCPTRTASSIAVDRPLFANVNIRCESCRESRALSPEADAARDGADKFIADHINCRRRKAS